MALETAGTFLPSECPLVSHVIMSYQKHHSPALTTIPEDEPLFEELKVVRPLNEIKSGGGSDVVNYHQIIRSYPNLSLRGESSLGAKRPISSTYYGLNAAPVVVADHVLPFSKVVKATKHVP
jgi:hypothetical protein